jgi:hypothetical protein
MFTHQYVAYLLGFVKMAQCWLGIGSLRDYLIWSPGEDKHVVVASFKDYEEDSLDPCIVCGEWSLVVPFAAYDGTCAIMIALATAALSPL